MGFLHFRPTSLAGDPAGAGGYAGRKSKLSYKIELVEKQNRWVAMLGSGQRFWAKSVLGQRRRAPEAPVSPLLKAINICIKG